MQNQPPSPSSLRDFLYILFKRKVQILLFFFGTVCVVTIGTFLMPPTYEATSQILVKVGRENLYVPTVPSRSTRKSKSSKAPAWLTRW